MILLDPELEPESLDGRRPVRWDPDADPTGKATSIVRAVVPVSPAPKRDTRLPSARTLGRFLSTAQGAVRLKGQVTVLLTTDEAIRKLNRQFRGKNKATDVLSFPAEGPGSEEIAGDLAISVTTALGQAIEQGHSLSTEIKVLILHGLLHLAGYDHEADNGKMARQERLLRARLGLPQGLIERAGRAEQRQSNAGKKNPSGAKAQVRMATLTARLMPYPFESGPRAFDGQTRNSFRAEPRNSKASKPQTKVNRP